MTYARSASSRSAAPKAAALVACIAVLAGGAACSTDSGLEREAAPLSNMTATGASGGVSGVMMPPGAGTAPAPGTGPNLLVAESWVDATTNGVGIQGAFFTYQDGSGRTLITADATRTQSGYCVTGTAAEVLEGNFAGTYGAVAALNLSQEVGSEALTPYDATAHGVVGFGFEISGNTGGALRFVVKQYLTHDGFCINSVPNCVSGCSVEYRIDELTQNCWTPGGAAPVATSLQALEWQITTREGAATDFDYCIENLRAVVDPSFAPAAAAPAAPADEEPVRSGY